MGLILIEWFRWDFWNSDFLLGTVVGGVTQWALALLMERRK